MASKTEICNLALGHIGVGKEIANIATEKTETAAVCNRFYETAKDAVLRDFEWPFATKFRDLSLIESNPTVEWGYSYSYPSDCLKMRRILIGNVAANYRVGQPYVTEDTVQRSPYRIVQGPSGTAIFSNQSEATAEYTARIDDPTVYPPDFVMALSWRLAAYIAPTVTGGDPFNLTQKAMQAYKLEIAEASAQSFNEEQPYPEKRSELERIRD